MVNTLREAPPTKNPSTSGLAANSLQFAPLTEPAVPYHGSHLKQERVMKD